MKIRLLTILLAGLFMFSGLAVAQDEIDINIKKVDVNNLWEVFLSDKVIFSDGKNYKKFTEKYDVLINKFKDSKITDDITYEKFKNKMKKSFVKLLINDESSLERIATGKTGAEELGEVVELSFDELELEKCENDRELISAIKSFSREVEFGDFSDDIKNDFKFNNKAYEEDKPLKDEDVLSDSYFTLIIARKLFGELYPSASKSSASVYNRTIVGREKISEEKMKEIYKRAGILPQQKKSTPQKSTPQKFSR